MLKRNGQSGAELTDIALKRSFLDQMARLDSFLMEESAFEKIDINYNELLANHHREIQRIKEFLDLPASVTDMCQVIDPSLYRQRLCASFA